MDIRSISKSTLTRLPSYLDYLKALPKGNAEYISASAIAGALGLGEVQVRKDLASVSTAGRPKVGYRIAVLIQELESFLGYNKTTSAIVVGVGRLGRALLDYEGFARYGIEVVAGFDLTPTGLTRGKPVMSIGRMAAYCRERDIRLGILAVPAASAQQVCDQMVQSGIRAILNFAPIHLRSTDDILIHNENIAVSLAMLSDQLERRQGE